uniref:Mediator of RNA polymerase II transcription subunit 9 n=1 Tax=Solanum lycopersicum TaxID=4081 RepID=A0A3Q7F1E2_SOLLC
MKKDFPLGFNRIGPFHLRTKVPTDFSSTAISYGPLWRRKLDNDPQHPNSQVTRHFSFLLVENLADTIENGNRDQHSDALVTELKNQFEKCQQLLTSISGSISSRSMTVEGQKRKKAECEQMLNQRRDLISRYKGSVEEIINSEL